MRVAVNASFFQPGHNYGAGTYVVELLRAWARVGAHEPVLIHNRLSRDFFVERLGGLERFEAPVSGANRAARIAYEQLLLQRHAAALGCAVLFCPGYLGPIRRAMPVVLTIHDCQFRDVAAMIDPRARLAYELLLPRAAAVADHVIAVSEFTRSRIVHHLGTPDDRVTTVLEGAPSLGPALPPAQGRALLARFGITEPFLMTVSGGGPHKNLERVKEGFRRFRARRGAAFQLVVVGHTDDGCGQDVIHTGFVAEQERDTLYRAAHAYVFGSLYEGFGLTLLEAMQAGLPVASSHAASLPEVGGDACVWFDPRDVGAISRAIEAVLTDEEVRARCRRRNLEQCARFSWDRCARETEAVLERAVAASSPRR
jgi:glycosyltransferase involved in cell wall biosynthesis